MGVVDKQFWKFFWKNFFIKMKFNVYCNILQ